MRALSPLLILALAGCASSPEPYPVEPQSVTVHFLSESEWMAFSTKRTLNGSWGMPSEIGGTARLKTNDEGEVTDCDIYFPADNPPTKYVLTHEMRHCSEGSFH